MRREGAQLAFTYQGEAVKDRVLGLAGEFDTDAIFACDVTSDQEIDTLFAQLGRRWDGLDGIVHSIAFAPARGARRRLSRLASRAKPSAWRTTSAATASPRSPRRACR